MEYQREERLSLLASPLQISQRFWNRGSLLPSTGIAAHVIEQEIEIEVEKFGEVVMDSSGVKKGAINAALRMPFRLPPPPPVPRNAYLQYEGDDENVVVDGL